MAQRLSAGMCGATESGAIEEDANCVCEKLTPMQSQYNTSFSPSSSVLHPSPVYDIRVAYKDRPSSCSGCRLPMAIFPRVKARMQLWVWTIIKRDGVSTTGLVIDPPSEAYRLNAASIAIAWEQVKSNLADGNSSATSSSQHSPDKPAAPFPPLPVGCWNPGCINMSGVCEASLCTTMCGRCRRARYCSLECQKEDLRRHQESKNLGGCRMP
jgi:hypothetical protein